MDEALRRRLEELKGSTLISYRRIERGYTPAERWLVRFSDGSTAFAKVGASPLTSDFLRIEHRRYQQLNAHFMPQLLGFATDPERPLLLLEDLSPACWPPPWQPGDMERLVETLRQVAATRPLPEDLPSLEEEFGSSGSDERARSGWGAVARDPSAFLGLGLCSAAWLSGAQRRLLEAQNEAVVSGNDLVHNDVRSDNLCLLPDRVVLIDWNLAGRGNGAFDLAFAAPSLRLEGGPLPEELVHDDGRLAAIVSGFFAAQAGLPMIPDAPRVRWIQLRQLRIALSWVARALDLPPPDLPWAKAGLARLGAALAQGELDERTWYEQAEEMIGDLYLASADPRQQSGKTGDELDWRWSRELVLDALPQGGSLLDVGCANGYFMESVQHWARERQVAIELYGVDISSRLVALARRRLPALAARIWLGNALDWAPPRRFDVVHTGLDYVPNGRQRDYVLRLLRDLVAANGQIVIRAERVVPGRADVVDQVRALGFSVHRIFERSHPRSGELRRAASIGHQL